MIGFARLFSVGLFFRRMDLMSVTYHDPVHGQLHVLVHCPFGGGGNSFNVNINNYYKGKIVKYNVGWISWVETPMLMQDDIDAIMDEIHRWSNTPK